MSLQKHLHWFAIAPVLLSCVMLALVTWSPLGVHTVMADTQFAFSSSDFSTTPETCDLNGDGKHDQADVSVLKLYWNGFPDRDIDCSADGFIDSRDLAILMHNWDGASPFDSNLPLDTSTYYKMSGYGYHLALPPAPVSGRKVGDRFTALLLLSTGASPIGAGEAVLEYDVQHLAVKEVRTNPSVWSVWTERPHPPFRNGQLVFAGGRPGGFTGSKGTLAAIQFEVTSDGSEMIKLSGESRAYRPDTAGTKSYQIPFAVDAETPTFDDATTVKDMMPAVKYYGVLPTEIAPSSFNTRSVGLDAVRAPTLSGKAWIVDLSSLSPDGGARSYEVREGWQRSVLQDEIYQLKGVSPGKHFLQVAVRGPDGTDWTVNVVVTVPGAESSGGIWNDLGFWIGLEIALAIVVVLIVWRRHARRMRRDTILRARMRSA